MRIPATLFTLLAAALLGLAPAQAEDAREACGAAVEVPAEHAQRLSAFAERINLRQVRAAAGTIWPVHATGRLPDCYLTKRDAEESGWRRGGDRWSVPPRTATGGDRLGNP